MKVLLIYPPLTLEERFGSRAGNAGGRQIPLGILYLASAAREQGHHLRIVDAEAMRFTARQVADLAADFAPGVVGISATTVAFHRALETARQVKHAMPQVTTVCGGPHVHHCAAEVIGHHAFDYAIKGEAEIGFCRFLRALETGESMDGIPGLVYRDNGCIRDNPPAEFIRDLDGIPFPEYDLLPDLRAYNPPATCYRAIPVASVLTARGCPCHCTFCPRNMGDSLRVRSADNVAREIELLHRQYGVREIAFADDTFTFRPDCARELFTRLDEMNIRLPWSCKSRVDTVDADLLRFMKDRGCWQISFGIESGDARILETIGKNIRLESAREVLAECAKLGIQTRGNFMIGHPGETPDTIEKTIRTALSMNLGSLVVTLNTPLPGTRQFEECETYGAMDVSDWARFNLNEPVFVPAGMTGDFLIKKQREFYTRFYFRPRIMWRFFLNLFSGGGLRRLGSALRSLPYAMFGR